jgi:hypothetical protein
VLRSVSGQVNCRDALLRAEGRGTTLVRLVRGLDNDLDLVHEVALGGFDQPWATWQGTTARIGLHELRVLGGSSQLDGRWLRTLDPESGQGLGNTPLVWSHMEAARAMHLLDSASLRQSYGLPGLALWRLGRWVHGCSR